MKETNVQPRLTIATKFWARMTGLLLPRVCPNGEILMIVPCRGIHTFGMRESIDLAFLDAQACVLASERDLVPSRQRKVSRAVAVLERRARPHEKWFEQGQQLCVSVLLDLKEDPL